MRRKRGFNMSFRSKEELSEWLKTSIEDMIQNARNETERQSFKHCGTLAMDALNKGYLKKIYEKPFDNSG